MKNKKAIATEWVVHRKAEDGLRSFTFHRYESFKFQPGDRLFVVAPTFNDEGKLDGGSRLEFQKVIEAEA